MQTLSIPRVMISAPSSSSGKTITVCALLQLLPDAAAIKCGPDFIDPLFHRTVLGRKTGTIDLFFSTEAEARALFAHDTAGAGVAVLEGAMGYYDGVTAAAPTTQASAFKTAQALHCPVVLVVDARGKSLSVCAEINGFASFRERDGDRSGICGVILNRCSAQLYQLLAPQIRTACGLPTLGHLDYHEDAAIPSRHLGLATPDTIDDVQTKLSTLAEAAAQTLDVAGIAALARSAPPLTCEDFTEMFVRRAVDTTERVVETTTPRIAYAYDEAFCFYYRENLDLLSALGAVVVPFSPLHDHQLPADCHALYLGGGYPELFPLLLADNTSMLKSIRAYARSGAPILAECGGFLYLQLAGVLPGTFSDTGHLTRFGYATLTANEDTLLCKKGEHIRAHEFHYFDTTTNGSAFTAAKPSGKTWQCMVNARAVADRPETGCRMHATKTQPPNIVAGFPHLYFPSNPRFAARFVQAAQNFAARSAQGVVGCTNCCGAAAGNGCDTCRQRQCGQVSSTSSSGAQGAHA